VIDSRDDQIVRLLDTRFDGLPEPTRRDHAAAGFVHKTIVREACTDCLDERPAAVRLRDVRRPRLHRDAAVP